MDDPIDPRGDPQALEQLVEAQQAFALLAAGHIRDRAALEAAIDDDADPASLLRGMRQVAYMGYARAAKVSGRTVEEEIQDQARQLAVAIGGLRRHLGEA